MESGKRETIKVDVKAKKIETVDQGNLNHPPPSLHPRPLLFSCNSSAILGFHPLISLELHPNPKRP
ncbi:hypothetical protein V2J09_015827 [Rumex salicifolius]